MATKTKGWTAPATEVLRATASTRIDKVDAGSTPGFDGDKQFGAALLEERGARLSALQEMLYANGRAGDRRSVLLVLQGMDTAGKGGIVRHVIGHVDPQGVDHAAFGSPTPEELRHHYLWRIEKALPRGGQIGVFDRSHYEDVLVVRVHNLVPPEVWGERYQEIVDFEDWLVSTETTVVKVLLAVSKGEQKRRLTQRLNRPDKYWKYDRRDLDERALWPDYEQAYQAVLDRTSTERAPWYVVPCNNKWYARLAVTELLIDALEKLELSWPPANFDVEAERLRLERS